MCRDLGCGTVSVAVDLGSGEAENLPAECSKPLVTSGVTLRVVPGTTIGFDREPNRRNRKVDAKRTNPELNFWRQTRVSHGSQKLILNRC